MTDFRTGPATPFAHARVDAKPMAKVTIDGEEFEVPAAVAKRFEEIEAELGEFSEDDESDEVIEAKVRRRAAADRKKKGALAELAQAQNGHHEDWLNRITARVDALLDGTAKFRHRRTTSATPPRDPATEAKARTEAARADAWRSPALRRNTGDGTPTPAAPATAPADPAARAKADAERARGDAWKSPALRPSASTGSAPAGPVDPAARARAEAERARADAWRAKR